jgi:hypothetical protein
VSLRFFNFLSLEFMMNKMAIAGRVVYFALGVAVTFAAFVTGLV